MLSSNTKTSNTGVAPTPHPATCSSRQTGTHLTRAMPLFSTTVTATPETCWAASRSGPTRHCRSVPRCFRAWYLVCRCTGPPRHPARIRRGKLAMVLSTLLEPRRGWPAGSRLLLPEVGQTDPGRGAEAFGVAECRADLGERVELQHRRFAMRLRPTRLLSLAALSRQPAPVRCRPGKCQELEAVRPWRSMHRPWRQAHKWLHARCTSHCWRAPCGCEQGRGRVHGIREQGATALTGTPPCVK
jgi:hypothetical protein